MPVPDFQTLMLPVLRRLAEAQLGIGELIAAISDEFALTEAERAEVLPSRGQPVMANRVHWALAYLNRAGLIERVSRGVYRAAPRGLAVLREPPERITTAFLRRYPEFRILRLNDGYAGEPNGEAAAETQALHTPEERVADAVRLIEAELRAALLGRVRAADPAFFERVVVELLLAMGYGDGREAGRVLGRSGDGGLDGVIREDRLGLDLIYVQAKRHGADNAVGPDKVREFSGALDFTGARKGVLITTSRFTAEAQRAADGLQAKRIVLVDGEELARLMLQHGVGVRSKGPPVVIHEIDLNFFEPDAPA